MNSLETVKLKDKNKDECVKTIERILLTIGLNLNLDHDNHEEDYIELPQGGEGVLLRTEKMYVLFTISITDLGRCITIGDLFIDKEYRNQYLDTRIISCCTSVCDFNKQPIGLWIKKDNQNLINLYTKAGFKLRRTKEHHWFEYGTEYYKKLKLKKKGEYSDEG